MPSKTKTKARGCPTVHVGSHGCPRRAHQLARTHDRTHILYMYTRRGAHDHERGRRPRATARVVSYLLLELISESHPRRRGARGRGSRDVALGPDRPPPLARTTASTSSTASTSPTSRTSSTKSMSTGPHGEQPMTAGSGQRAALQNPPTGDPYSRSRQYISCSRVLRGDAPSQSLE